MDKIISKCVLLILDTVSLADLNQYKQAIGTLPNSPLICGFVSGREELASWCRADLFRFYYDTIPYHGDLEDISVFRCTILPSAVYLGQSGCFYFAFYSKNKKPNAWREPFGNERLQKMGLEMPQ